MKLYHEDEEIARLVSSVSGVVGRRFSGYASRDDISQEIWAWVYTHPSKMSEWEALADDGARKLKRAMYHVATGWAQEQKAQQLGYRTRDLFYYRLETIRLALPVLFEHGFDLSNEAYADFTDRALWLDIVRAVGALSEADYRLLSRVFSGDPERETIYAEVAAESETTPAAIRQRTTRILMKIQRTLGGPSPDNPEGNPHRRRKVRSNAAAIAETRRQYDE